MSYTVTENGFKLSLGETDAVRSVLQNIAVILATARGSAPLYRDFGLPQSFLDKPAPVARALAYAEIKEAVEQFEPRAEVLGVDFAEDGERPGRIVPTVEVRIIDD